MLMRGRCVLGSRVTETNAAGDTVVRVGPRALAYLRGGRSVRLAVLRRATAAGLTVTVASHVGDALVLDVTGRADALGAFLDSGAVDNWDWVMDARPPGYSRAPGFGDPGPGPRRENGQRIVSAREADRRSAVKAATRNDSDQPRPSDRPAFIRTSDGLIPNPA